VKLTNMKQKDLFETKEDWVGRVYDHKFDFTRLKKQRHRVWAVMISHEWVTLSEISNKTGDPEASISASLRDFRKPQYGSHSVMKIPRGSRQRGLWEYKLVENTSNETS